MANIDPISGKRLGRAAPREIVLPAAALAPADCVPEPPLAMGVEARRVWDETCLNLSGMGVLAKVDYPLLASWCVAFAAWVRVANRIAEIEAGDDDEMQEDERTVRKEWCKAIMQRLKAGDEISRQDLREFQRQQDADLYRVASLQIAAGKLLDQVERIGKQFGFSPASRIQLACMLKQAEARVDGEEFFRESRL